MILFYWKLAPGLREVREKINDCNNYGEDASGDGDSTESNYDNYWGNVNSEWRKLRGVVSRRFKFC